MLTAFPGPIAPAPIAVTSPSDPGSTHTDTSWAQITDEVVIARVWEGVHFRFSDDAAVKVGGEVGFYDLFHLHSIGL